MMICFADLIDFQQSLTLDDTCYVFEFEIHNTVHVRSALSANASEYGLGGFVRRISKKCVVCKVVSTLDNKKNFNSFLRELRTYGKKNLVYHANPRQSTDEQDIDVAFSKRFVVHGVPLQLRDVDNPSPDTKGDVPWDNVSVSSARSGSDGPF
jgi:hypothetical protein